MRTYIGIHDTRKGRTFQVRVIDARTGTDVKRSASTFKQAVQQALLQTVQRQ